MENLNVLYLLANFCFIAAAVVLGILIGRADKLRSEHIADDDEQWRILNGRKQVDVPILLRKQAD